MSIVVRSNSPVAAVSAPVVSEGAGQPAAEPKEPGSAPDAPASEPKDEPNASETLGTEEAEEESETAEGSETESESEGAEQEKPGKKKSGFQRKVNKLNARIAQTTTELEYWKQQALKNASGSKPEPGQSTQAENKPKAAEGKPNPDNFNTHAEYIEALTDWKVDQKDREREQKLERSKVQTAQAEAAKTFQTRRAEFAAKQADFEDVLSEVEHIPVSLAVNNVILDSEHGPEIAYELAKNPKEYERINKLPPLAAARELGKIEARISQASSEKKKPETNKITQAPKPMNPLKGGKGAPVKSLYDADRMSQAEYEALRRAKPKK